MTGIKKTAYLCGKPSESYKTGQRLYNTGRAYLRGKSFHAFI